MALLVALPAWAHTTAELDAFRVEWVARAEVALSPGLFAEWADMAERHPGYFNPTPEDAPHSVSHRHGPPSGSRSPGVSGVEAWRPLVAIWFSADQVNRALCIIGHESGGDAGAFNPSSGASGLFQQLPKYWTARSSSAGWAGANIFNPEANVAVSAWLQQRDGWTHWSPYNRGLCR